MISSPQTFEGKMKTQFRLIGLTGTNGAGKGEAASFFVEKGYAYFSLSDLIREELQKRNMPLTRDNLIRTGNEMRKRTTPDILARLAAKKIRRNTVIDSIRNPKEIAYFQTLENFTLLAIDAPPELRFERVKKRGRDESAANLSEFLAKEKEEMGTGEGRQQLLICMDMADHRITNDGTLEELREKLEKFL